MRAQRGPAARAVRDDLVALVEQALVADLPQRPPHRLDVVGVERAVGVVEVEPEPDALRQPVPVLQVGEDRLAAALVELLDPVGLDLLLRGDPELLLDRDLDGQPVAVPAALALDVVAAHRLVARVDVLEDPREHVVGARAAVGGRRPLVEHPLRAALPAAQRLVEDVALAPALQHLLLELGEGLVGIDGRGRHEPPFSQPAGAGQAASLRHSSASVRFSCSSRTAKAPATRRACSGNSRSTSSSPARGQRDGGHAGGRSAGAGAPRGRAPAACRRPPWRWPCSSAAGGAAPAARARRPRW